MSETTLSGQCLCGACRFTLYGAKEGLHACHCPICQKWTGGPFVGVEGERVEFADGAPIGRYRSSDWAERVFCKECGTHLIWQLQEGGMPVATAGVLESPPQNATLQTEYFIDTKPDGYAMAGEHTRLTRKEVEALFGGSGG